MSGVGTLVVDSGALIKGASLDSWSQNVVTIRDVLSEVKDVNTRRRLQVLPYSLSFKEPTLQALHHGTILARETSTIWSTSILSDLIIAVFPSVQ